jgi:hypothetical protein
LKHGWKNEVLGGYTLSGTAELSPGPLLTFSNLFYVGDPNKVRLKKPIYVENDKTGVNYIQTFNTQSVTSVSATTVNGVTTCSYTGTGFVSSSVTNYAVCQPNGYNLRVFPLHVEGVRQQSIANYNANVAKTFSLTERVNFTPQLYAYNLFNHQRAAGANTNPTNTQFGQTNGDQSGANARGLTFYMILRF